MAPTPGAELTQHWIAGENRFTGTRDDAPRVFAPACPNPMAPILRRLHAAAPAGSRQHRGAQPVYHRSISIGRRSCNRVDAPHSYDNDERLAAISRPEDNVDLR